jgi:hypothetical protein
MEPLKKVAKEFDIFLASKGNKLKGVVALSFHR